MDESNDLLTGLHAYLEHARYEHPQPLITGSAALIGFSLAIGYLPTPRVPKEHIDDVQRAARLAFLSHVCGREIASTTLDGWTQVSKDRCLTLGETWALERWFTGQELNGRALDDPDMRIAYQRRAAARAWVYAHAAEIVGPGIPLQDERAVDSCWCCGLDATREIGSLMFAPLSFPVCDDCTGDLWFCDGGDLGEFWIFSCVNGEHTKQSLARESYWRLLLMFNEQFAANKRGPRSPFDGVDWIAQFDALRANWEKESHEYVCEF